MSICLFRFVPYPPSSTSRRRTRPHDPNGIQSLLSAPLVSPRAPRRVALQVEQSISIPRESLLNLEFVFVEAHVLVVRVGREEGETRLEGDGATWRTLK